MLCSFLSSFWGNDLKKKSNCFYCFTNVIFSLTKIQTDYSLDVLESKLHQINTMQCAFITESILWTVPDLRWTVDSSAMSIKQCESFCKTMNSSISSRRHDNEKNVFLSTHESDVHLWRISCWRKGVSIINFFPNDQTWFGLSVL